MGSCLNQSVFSVRHASTWGKKRTVETVRLADHQIGFKRAGLVYEEIAI
jgi:hypothetical protein